MATVFWIILWILCLDTLTSSRVNGNGLKTLHSQCPDGYFGYTCRFRCRCKGSEICNKIHGNCASGCKDGFWGPGCQLSNSCFYNDQKRNYMGTKSMTKSLYICQPWQSQLPHQHTYKPRDFPDRFYPNNYCRTTADSAQPWCYTSDNRVRWEHCNIKNCRCPAFRFGHNCAKECHCRDRSESCDSILGMCKNGCAQGWRGFDCQTPAACPSNRYGWACNKRCQCKTADHCNRFSGPEEPCECRQGFFNPPNCEPVTEPKILYFGNVRVNPGQPGIFNCTVAAFPTPYESEIMLIGPQGKRITLLESKILNQYLYTRFNLFKVNYVLNGEHYTCAVTATAGSTSTTIRVDVYELARLNTPPSVVKGSITSRNITIEWHKWSRPRGDTGDKPILWYSVYVKAETDTSYRNAGIVYNLFCERKCSYTVGELQPNTKYAVYIVTRRDGEGGDGPPGPLIHVTTDCSGPAVGPTINDVSGQLQYNKTYPKTRLLVQWIGPSANDMKCNQIKDYTLRLSSPEVGGKASTWKVPGGAVTSMSIPNQEPSTWYCVQLKFNTVTGFSSPFSEQKCILTPETTPGSPTNFSLRRQTPTSLTMSWNRPDPTNGNITLYRIMFWEGVSTIAKGVEWRTTLPFVEFTLTGLRPHTDYQVQVQAVNSAGPGEPTPILTTKTEESVPGPVPDLRNTTRSINSIRLRWDKPKYMNGDLLHFTVSCEPMKSLNKNAFPQRAKEVKLPADVYEVTMNGLLPATQYACSINASTSKGSGSQTKVVVWTEATDPETPIEPVIVGVSDHTVTLDLKDTEDKTVSFYRVIVEKIADGKHKREAPQSITKIGDDFHRAARQGSRAYITAQLDRDRVNGKFVVGDNKTYGGFYNAPLERDQTYNIWFGAFSKVDGTERRSFSRAERPVVVRAITTAPQTNHVPVIIGVLVIFILLIITFAILLLVWRKRHMTAEREKSDLPSFGPTILPEPDTSPPPTPIDNIEIEPLILPTTEYDIDTEPIYGNVGIDIPPIKVEDLWDYIRSSKENDYEGLKREYRLIPAGLTASCDAAKKNENKPKNRYGNIIAYDHSRVVLDTENGDVTDDYINANYIDGYNKPKAYIAAQGPNRPTIPDIWRMVWQENSKTIIMLTNALETGKKKCEQYWPDEGCEEYGTISVQLLGTDYLPDYIIRTFLLSQKGQSKYVKQFHYTTWPDHGVPKFGHSLLLFRQKIRAYDNLDNGTVIVHCSAGVGRTGTYISIDTQLEKAKSEGLIDVHNFVQLMRTQRVNMVQTLEQYIFVYDCLLEALICGDTPVSSHNYPEAYKEMCQFDSEIGKSKIEEQFEILKLLSSTIERDDTTSALRPENIFKNRCKNIIPANRCRPYLNTHAEGCNDYINAVYINSYQKKDAYIVTQMPLPNTVIDFWRLIYDHHSSSIVMLNEIDKDETCEQYWTLDTCGNNYGPFLVETTAEIKSDPSVTIRDFTITNTQNPQETPRVVRQFQFHHWAEGSNVPSSKMALLELLELVDTWQMQFDRPVTVHCMNGASRCGLFCAVSCILERVKTDKEVDVFQAVKQLRLSRTQLIDNMEQYKFCHEIVLDFLSSPGKNSILS
ncbi:receptor-type tyrosine-protein phosphatase T-like isoform X2 [Gigantopelta aegis]|uniref:receptor-type tyrosine-protein phosphatase T-like isoform X2 n=1 Tax=Gigantopelta aegis TaxID=1735272 RepID=UPI001B889419|nr:receptor-type tyrosine-protein phosphatase T-like isoform X2 [Gigantopelta aegis]